MHIMNIIHPKKTARFSDVFLRAIVVGLDLKEEMCN